MLGVIKKGANCARISHCLRENKACIASCGVRVDMLGKDWNVKVLCYAANVWCLGRDCDAYPRFASCFCSVFCKGDSALPNCFNVGFEVDQDYWNPKTSH